MAKRKPTRRRHMRRVVRKNPDPPAIESPRAALDLIEKRWRGDRSVDIAAALDVLRQSLPLEQGKEEAIVPMETVGGDKYFSILRLLRDVLAARDGQFLKRQQAYHVAASATLPYVCADAGQIKFVLDRLISFAASRAPLGERLEIAVNEAKGEENIGIEVAVIAKDTELKGCNHADFLRRLYTEGEKGREGGMLSLCRQMIVTQRGEMRCEVGKQHHVEYHLFLPAKEAAPGIRPGARQTYRYDIAIRNFALLRKSYGIRKCSSLVHQLEELIRSLVRHPLDVVLCSADEGMVTAIYESQLGAAESVASRISQRLAKEVVKIGKKAVNIEFRYTLTIVPVSPVSVANQMIA